MRDKGISPSAEQGPEVHYYLTHPSVTSQFMPPQLRHPEDNYGATIASRALPHREYPLWIHVLQGPTIGPSLNVQQIDELMADVNTIWSQAGVGFRYVQAVRPVGSDQLVRPTGNDEIDAVHALSTYADYVDLFLVDSMRDATDPANPQNVAGETWTKSQNLGSPNVIVSANYMPAVDLDAGKRRSRARTISHELMHYLLDWGATMHDGRSNTSLALYGDSEVKRDISDADVERQRASTITVLRPDGS